MYGQTASLLEKLILGSRSVPVVEGHESDVSCPPGSRPLTFESHRTLQKFLSLQYVEFLEIFCGYGQLTLRVAETGVSCGEGIDSKVVAYG